MKTRRVSSCEHYRSHPNGNPTRERGTLVYRVVPHLRVGISKTYDDPCNFLVSEGPKLSAGPSLTYPASADLRRVSILISKTYDDPRNFLVSQGPNDSDIPHLRFGFPFR